MKKLKLYLETTMFNRYVEHGRKYCEETRMLFKKISEGRFDAYTSGFVLEELEKAPEEKKIKMIALIKDFEITPLTARNEIRELAAEYLKHGIMPQGSLFDALHVACASYYGMDVIVSLNFRHINRFKTKILTEGVNRSYGYRNVIISDPMEVIADEEF